MVTRDLRFNIFADDRASAAFARASAAADALASRLAGLDGKRVRAKIEADTSQLEAKLAQAESQLNELNRKRANPKIDADIAAAQAKMVRLATELQKLNKERTQVKIDADTAAAQAELTALHDRLDELGRSSASPRVALETFDVRKKIDEVQARLAALDQEKANPEIGLRTAEIEAQMARLRAQIFELNQLKASPKVDADIRVAEAKIAAIRRQIEDLKEHGLRVRTADGERDLDSFLGKLNNLRRGFQRNITAAALLVRNIRQLVMPVSLAGFIPTFASIGASIETAAQAMALLPAAAGFAAAAISTLTIGFHGLFDAIGPRDTGTQRKKADRELQRLGESAQEVAKKVIDLKDEWNALKKAVQNELFKGLADDVERFAKRYIPILKDGMGDLAATFNDMFEKTGRWLTASTQVDRVNKMFHIFNLTLQEAAPGFQNILEAFFDLSEVGATFLPGLAQGFSNVTNRFKEFINEAKHNGDLQLWIAQGIVSIQEMGRLIGNVGGIFGAVFEAARASGDSFVESMILATGEVEKFLKSGQGQAGLIALFKGIHDAIESIMPGIKAIGAAIADSLVIIQPAVTAVGTAFSQFAAAVAPTLTQLASLAVDVIVPIAVAFGQLSTFLGPVIPMVLSLAVAFKLFTGVGAMFLTAGAAIKTFATSVGMAGVAMGMSGTAAQSMHDATNRLGNVMSRVGNSLPLIGTAVIGLVAAYDALGSKADELATKVVNGSMSIQEAIAAEIAQVEANQIFWRSANQQKEAHVAATNRVREAMGAQLAVMDPLERAQTDVTLAEANYLVQLELHGAKSQEASTAAEILKAAKERLTTETWKHTDATKTNTEALIENSNQVSAAANADLALERAQLRLEEQQARTTEELNKHSASSIEGRKTLMDLKDANLQVADAARRKAQADAEARGESDAAAQGAKAYENKLIELAAQAKGPTREALLIMVANLDSTKSGANDAALAAAGLKGDIERVPKVQTTEFKQPGMPGARSEVQGLGRDVDALKDKKFKITASGEVLGVGNTGYATGGVLPGYTPGRDVHEFRSPTGGVLGLSGGEAVMRPEWTRVMGSDYINAANKAARAGGIGGVAAFMSRTGPRAPGVEGKLGDGNRFANGGVIGGALAGAAAGRVVESPTDFEWKGPTISQWFDKAATAIMKSYGGNALMWAKMQVGKPYVWGGVGPFGYDCSGFLSGIVNVMRGRNPYSRVGATGNFPWSGFRPGMGPGLSIGAFKGNPGHMAGTLNGTNVEASGGVGVRVGGGARGASNSMFNVRAHLPFDKGGVAFHPGLLEKLTNKPERVLSPEQTQSFERLVQVLDTVRGSVQQPTAGGGSESVTAEVARLRSDMQALGETIRTGIRTARPITVEDRSGNPVETGRAVSLALRL